MANKLKTVYFKMIAQKTTPDHTILVAVVPNDFLGDNVPDICEMEAFKSPPTIYSGTYPSIRINTDTINARPDLKGMGIAGIITSDGWAVKETESDDTMGVGL